MKFVQIDNHQLMRDYANGMSLRALAIKYGCSRPTIRRKLQNAGMVIKSSKQWIDANKERHREISTKRYNISDDQIINLYINKKLTINEISIEMGISTHKVASILKKHSITLRKIDYSKRFAKIYDKVKPVWATREHLEDNIKYVALKNLLFKVVPPDMACEFYDKYHYLRGRRGGEHIAAVVGNDIVCCATFAPPLYVESAKRLNIQTTQLKELVRYARHPKYYNKNLGSYTMKRFIKMFVGRHCGLKCLISFADMSAGHDGALYKASGWQYDGETNPSYYYVKDGQCWHKRTIWQYARQMRKTEREFVEMFGINKIVTLPKKRFLYWIKQ